ncbi:hypothetical protein VN97_g12566 [Penicillium thymicola]|uniref:Uncharacterized protein n=1 Tax=Penicillium thymicola TaxID=293382 RepID=A0AAI9T5A8_PENTH|nr:hypothetical protein VN97_g12566 [Penicillium thymicola]
MVQLRSQNIVRDALHLLYIIPDHTTSSALHPISFVGPSREWQNFVRDAENFDANQRWSKIVIDHDSLPYKDSPTSKLAAKRPANFLQIHFRFNSDLIYFKSIQTSLSIGRFQLITTTLVFVK